MSQGDVGMIYIPTSEESSKSQELLPALSTALGVSVLKTHLKSPRRSENEPYTDGFFCLHEDDTTSHTFKIHDQINMIEFINIPGLQKRRDRRVGRRVVCSGLHSQVPVTSQF